MKKPLMKFHLAQAKHHLNISKLHGTQAEGDKDHAEFHKAMQEAHLDAAASHKELCEALNNDVESHDTKKFLRGIETNILRNELNIREDIDTVGKVRGAVDFDGEDSHRRVTLVPRAGAPVGDDLSADPEFSELFG